MTSLFQTDHLITKKLEEKLSNDLLGNEVINSKTRECESDSKKRILSKRRVVPRNPSSLNAESEVHTAQENSLTYWGQQFPD